MRGAGGELEIRNKEVECKSVENRKYLVSQRSSYSGHPSLSREGPGVSWKRS
jgi:hypothetical protein